jgi:hypothetical protein
MIAAPVVPFRQIDKLPANARRARQPRQFGQPVGHLPVIIVVRERRACFAHGHAHPENERAAGRYNEAITAIGLRRWAPRSAPLFDWIRRSRRIFARSRCRGNARRLDRAAIRRERRLLAELNESLETKSVSFAGMNHMELERRKQQQGRCTLNSPF